MKIFRFFRSPSGKKSCAASSAILAGPEYFFVASLIALMACVNEANRPPAQETIESNEHSSGKIDDFSPLASSSQEAIESGLNVICVKLTHNQIKWKNRTIFIIDAWLQGDPARGRNLYALCLSVDSTAVRVGEPWLWVEGNTVNGGKVGMVLVHPLSGEANAVYREEAINPDSLPLRITSGSGVIEYDSFVVFR